MRWRGTTHAAISAALIEENRQRCSPPLTEREVRGIATSVARYPAGQYLGSGFVPQGYTDAHAALLEVLRFTADLPGFPVLLFLVERTLIWGKESDRVALR